MANTQRPNADANLISIDEARKLIAAENTKKRVAGKTESMSKEERSLTEQSAALREAHKAATTVAAKTDIAAKLKTTEQQRKALAFVRRSGVLMADLIAPASKFILSLAGPSYVATDTQRLNLANMIVGEIDAAVKALAKVQTADADDDNTMTAAQKKKAARAAYAARLAQ